MKHPLTVLKPIALTIAATEAALGSPKSTATIERGVQTGFSPKPTTRAILGARWDSLFNRQAALDTCGYYNGYPQTCAAGYACVTNYGDFAAGCCLASEITACTIFTSCLNYGFTCPECSGNPLIGSCTNILYPSCFIKIWNYATRYTEWDCNSIGGAVTFAENPALVSTATFGGTTSIANLIPAASQTTTVTVSSPGGGNGNSNGINGNGNTQNDGNTYVYNNGKGAASGSSWDKLTLGLKLLLQLHVFLALFHMRTWV